MTANARKETQYNQSNKKVWCLKERLQILSYILFVMGLACLIPITSHAAAENYTWAGGGVVTDWTDAANWAGGTDHPGNPGRTGSSGDTVSIDQTGSPPVGMILPTAYTIASMSIDADTAGAMTFSVVNSGTFAITGALTLDGGTGGGDDITFNLDSAETLSVGGNLAITSAAGAVVINLDDDDAVLTVSGNLVFNNAADAIDATGTSATINVGGDFNIATGTYTPATGTVNMTSTDAATFTHGANTINNLTVSGAGPITLATNLAVGGALTIDSGGNLDAATNNATLTVTGVSTIDGTLDSGSGVITANGALVVAINGFVDIDDNAGELEAALTTTLNGTVRLSSTGTLDFDGVVTIGASGSLLVSAAGTVELAANLDNSANGSVSMSAGTLQILSGLTYTVGSGTNTISTLDVDFALVLAGTGTLDIDGNIDADNDITGGSNADVTIAGNVDNSNGDNINLSGAVTFDGAAAQTITLAAGTTAFGSTVNGISVTGTAQVALATAAGAVGINGDVTISSNAQLTLGVSGDEEVTFANNVTVTNNGTFTAAGGAGDKTLLKASTIDTGQWFLVNSGTANFTDTVIRDCTYSGNGSVVATRLLNSTGNSGWDASLFSSPVSSGDSAVTTFTPTEITGDTITYDVYANTDADLFTNGTITVGPQLNQNEGAPVQGDDLDTGSVWDSNDTTDPTEVPAGSYYVYLIEQNDPNDAFIIISSYTVQIGLSGFVSGDEPLGGDDYAFTSFTILWTDLGDDEVTIELRYSTNASLAILSEVLDNANTTQITTVAGDAADTYNWDTSALATAGGTTYYVYVLSHSGAGSSFDVSDGLVVINGVTFTAPADTGSTADTADSSAVTNHINYPLAWSGPQDFSAYDITGSATSNGAADGTTVIDTVTATLSSTDDYYNGATLKITSGVSNGEVRSITDYNGTTKTFTVSPAFSNQIVSAVTFTVGVLNFDVYASTTQYTTVTELLAASDVLTVDTGQIPVTTSQTVNWDLTTTGSGSSFVPEGVYYIYLLADDTNGSSYDELVTATGQVTVTHNPYFYAGSINVSSDITGTTTGNGASDGTTALGAASLSAVDDFFNGAVLTITSGVSNGETRLIVDYVGATKTFTVAPAFGNQIATSTAYRISDVVVVSASADSGAAISTPDPVTLRWAGNDVDEASTVVLYYSGDSNSYSSAADIESGAGTTTFSFGSALPELNSSYTSWDYYSTSTNLVPAGTYYIWAVMTDGSGDKAFKRSDGTITVAHSSKIRIDNPPIGQTTTVGAKFTTLEWTDVDYDASGDVDFYYSTTDLLTGGIGGPVTTSGALTTILGYSQLNTSTTINEDDENAGDRFLIDFNSFNFNDSAINYIYAVIDGNSDGTPEYGHQSGAFRVQHGSRITVTVPAAADAASSNFEVSWQQEWEGYSAANAPMDVDLYFASVNTNTLGNLDNFSPNATQGIIERDISIDSDSDGQVDASGTAFWDDIIITSTGGATATGDAQTLIDSTLPTLANNYLKGRRLVVTGGTLEGESATISGSVDSTKTITLSTSLTATIDASSVTSYKIYVPDGTYYIYGVLDTNVTSDVQNRYNANDLDTTTTETDDAAVEGTTSGAGAVDGTTAVDSTLLGTDDYYNGNLLTITGGALIGESRTITDYVGASGTITVSPAFSAQVGGTIAYRISRPEISSVSVGTVTINNYKVEIETPSEFHDVGDAFNTDFTLDTGGQAVTAQNIYVDFDTNTLELVNPTAPFSVVTLDTTDAAGASDGTTLDGNNGVLVSTVDYYNGDTLIITSGAARGESRTVSDYDGAGLFTVSPAFSAQITNGTTYAINRALGNATNYNVIGSWTGLNVVENTGDNSTGQLNLVVISGVTDAASFSGSSSFISAAFSAKASGNTEMTYVFDSTNNRMTRMFDEDGAEHIPHNAGSTHIRASDNSTASIIGKVRLQNRTNHSALVTFELRKPGSLGHYSGYAPAADEDTATAGVQITTGTDGSFTLATVPAGEYYLTAKSAHYLRGQNDDTQTLTVRPGVDAVNVVIRGYSDANSDGDFADSGEEFDYLLAGEAGTEDNQITLTDLSAFASNFGLTTQAALDAADINGDGTINILDFTLIAANWGVSGIGPTGTAGVSNAAPGAQNSMRRLTVSGLPEMLQIGERYQVTVLAADVSGLTGFGFDINYDKEKAHLRAVRGAQAFGKKNRAIFLSKETDKRILIGGALRSNTSTSRRLVQFELEPITEGELTLTFDQGQLMTSVGAEDLLKRQLTFRVVEKPVVKESFLGQNFPNPFNPETWIPYALKDDAQVEIHIYDAVGRQVRVLELGFRASGYYMQRDNAAYWDGRNLFGERVASGVYFYQIKAGDFQSVSRMVILK